MDVTCDHRRDFAGVIKLRTLRWGHETGLAEYVNVITGVFIQKRKKRFTIEKKACDTDGLRCKRYSQEPRNDKRESVGSPG